ncbi:MAG: hypothetical protein FWC82_02015, partial [Firmicutes bacterium]|nr:hypothetical protein [Bacillota bacterium]
MSNNEKDNKIEPSLEEETILHEDFGKAKTALKDEDAKWYILHTYSGYEMMVQDNLKMVFQKNNMEDRLLKIAIPMEDVIEEKGGKRKVVQRKMFPTYVYVKMHYL